MGLKVKSLKTAQGTIINDVTQGGKDRRNEDVGFCKTKEIGCPFWVLMCMTSFVKGS